LLELLLILFALALPFRLWQRHQSRRQNRIDAAYDRARLNRLSGAGPIGGAKAIYGERFYNPR
jgi:hypothetical protein